MKKSRILYILKFLYENSDEAHPVSSKEIMEYLIVEGFEIHRTTINSDVALIIEIGIDLIVVRSSPNRYFIGERVLEHVELKMLVDSIISSKAISSKKSEKLIEKIGKLTSKYLADDLHREFYVDKIYKPCNELIYYTMDTIQEAIKEKSWIDFKYFEYTPNKEKVYKYNGYLYEICPYTTFWSDDHYYVVGYSRKHRKITVFRIDRMDKTRLYDDVYLPAPEDFDPSIYANQIFEMYDGDSCKVELRCANHLMDVIVDKFGEDVETTTLGSKQFKATVDVHLSPRFYGWMFGFVGDISIISPIAVKEEFINQAKKIVLSE